MATEDIPQIDARTAYEQGQRGEAGIVDVREPSEWDLGHIDGATWIPLGEIPYRWRELDPARKWIFVCRMGGRSNYAAGILRQAGLDASNLAGGMLDWKAQDLPMTAP